MLKNWPKLKSIRDISSLLSFANFYQRYIKSFNKIAKLLILILKTNLITFLTISESLNGIINKNEINIKHINEKKNLPTVFIFQKFTRKDYLIFSTKKIFNIL